MIVIFTLLTGCDPLYGVRSSGMFSTDMDVACLKDALASDPAFKTAKLRQGGRANEGSAISSEPLAYAWSYGEDNQAILQVTPTKNGWSFRNSLERMGENVSKAERDRFTPTMLRVNKMLEKRCGLRIADVFRG